MIRVAGKRLGRRELLKLSALAGASSLIAACQVAAPGATTPLPISTPSTAPKRGGTLAWGQSLINDELDPALANSGGSQEIDSQIYEGLIALADDHTVVPRLASKWSVHDGGKKFTFTLRDDVTFHDGTPLDSGAVKASWERALDPATRSTFASQFGPVGAIETPDAQTVVVTYKQPYPSLLIQAWRSAFAVISPKVLASLKKGDKITTHVGTGPFKYGGRTPDGVVTLERFEGYRWGPTIRTNRSAPYLQTLKLRAIVEPGTRVATLESGESLFVDELPEQDYLRLKNDARFRFTLIPWPGTPLGFYYNLRKSPLDERPVREAMNHAVDRQGVLEKVFFGVGRVEMSAVAHGVAGRVDDFDNAYPFDLARARQLLDAAGWQTGADGIRAKGGQRLSLVLATYRPAWGQLAEVLQSQLRVVGVDVQIQRMQQAPYLDFIRGYRHHLAETVGIGVADFGQLFARYRSDQIGTNNYLGLADPQLDSLLDRGSQLPIGSPERRQTYEQAQRQLMASVPGVFVMSQVKIEAMSARVRDFRGLGPEPQYGADMVDVWLET